VTFASVFYIGEQWGIMQVVMQVVYPSCVAHVQPWLVEVIPVSQETPLRTRKELQKFK